MCECVCVCVVCLFVDLHLITAVVVVEGGHRQRCLDLVPAMLHAPGERQDKKHLCVCECESVCMVCLCSMPQVRGRQKRRVCEYVCVVACTEYGIGVWH